MIWNGLVASARSLVRPGARDLDNVRAGELLQVHLLKVHAAVVVHCTTSHVREGRKGDAKSAAERDRKAHRCLNPGRRGRWADDVRHRIRKNATSHQLVAASDAKSTTEIGEGDDQLFTDPRVEECEGAVDGGVGRKLGNRVDAEAGHDHLAVAAERAKRVQHRRQAQVQPIVDGSVAALVHDHAQAAGGIAVVVHVLVETVRDGVLGDRGPRRVPGLPAAGGLASWSSIRRLRSAVRSSRPSQSASSDTAPNAGPATEVAIAAERAELGARTSGCPARLAGPAPPPLKGLPRKRRR